MQEPESQNRLINAFLEPKKYSTAKKNWEALPSEKRDSEFKRCIDRPEKVDKYLFHAFSAQEQFDFLGAFQTEEECPKFFNL